jgi:hypothetical protein
MRSPVTAPARGAHNFADPAEAPSVATWSTCGTACRNWSQVLPRPQATAARAIIYSTPLPVTGFGLVRVAPCLTQCGHAEKAEKAYIAVFAS